jgi:hypothetical protein
VLNIIQNEKSTLGTKSYSRRADRFQRTADRQVLLQFPTQKAPTRLTEQRRTGRRPVIIPAGSWPLEMRSETAAAYCDEPSVNAFLAKVKRGIYCAPSRERGCLPKWHRLKLDRDIARLHGLRFDNVDITEDIAGLI